MKQFVEEMTPVRIIDRGKNDGVDAFWRVCTFGDDQTKRFKVSVSATVMRFLEQPPHEYDIDDIVIAFVEMAFGQGHKEGEFVVASDSTEYDHLIAYIRTIG